MPALSRSIDNGCGVSYWRDLLQTGVDVGARNNTLASLVGHLWWHGVDATVTREPVLAWNHMRCRPPLPDTEVLRVVDSITREHLRHS